MIKAGRHRRKRYSASDYIFYCINGLLLFIFFVILAYPLLYIIMASFNGGQALGLNLWPARFTLDGYRAIWDYDLLWLGYRNSLFYVVVGTLVSLIATICCAYPLSRKDFKGGGVMTTLCLITMYFSGGLIPTYLLIRNLNLLNNFWVMILPGALNVYNMIVMRTFFKSTIPDELLEASQLDGCGDFRFLVRIVLPLSGSIIAVISLYVAVNIWNSYFEPMIYIDQTRLKPLSLFLREILVTNTVNLSDASQASVDPLRQMEMQTRQRVMKYSTIIVASVPVMLMYPFVQKYFVKGVMIGSIKG